MLHLSGVVEESITDGTGIRYVVFTQGCLHKCKGCHNELTHSYSKDSGYFRSIDDILLEVQKNPLLDGVTVSGGEPFSQPIKVLELVRGVKNLGLNVWVFSGYKIEELLSLAETTPEILEILRISDVLVDGKFILNKKDLTLDFRGSSNQRLIKLKDYFENSDLISDVV